MVCEAWDPAPDIEDFKLLGKVDLMPILGLL